MAIDDVMLVGHGSLKVVAVHGIQGTRDVWLPLARALSDRCTFVLPNLPGRGHAMAPVNAQACSLEAFAEVLRQTLADHVDGSFVLAGWSMGVSVALAYLASASRMPAPRLPAELLLLSGTPRLNGVEWFKAGSQDALLDAIAERERRLGLQDAADHRTVAWTWEAIRGTDQRGELGRVACPTLVIHGSDDTDCPLSHGAMLADGIPHAELHVLHGAGHSLLTQHTAEIAAHLRQRWRLADRFHG